jgi:hypothetical protein
MQIKDEIIAERNEFISSLPELFREYDELINAVNKIPEAVESVCQKTDKSADDIKIKYKPGYDSLDAGQIWLGILCYSDDDVARIDKILREEGWNEFYKKFGTHFYCCWVLQPKTIKPVENQNKHDAHEG